MKSVNKTPNILLNYLQIANSLGACDISNFLPKTQILKLYKELSDKALEDVLVKIKKAESDFKNATKSAERGRALNSINKYPKLQELIKTGADLDSSQELKDLKQLYDDEPLRFLNSQILEANKFIASKEVQEQIALDFNSFNHKTFDVNNGDNNCQSRIFLMDIFSQGIPYAELTQSEQLVLSLCHITSQYKKEIRDVFGLLIKETDNHGDIKYGTSRLLSIKPASKIGLNTNAFYSVSDLISNAISQISSSYMLEVADTIGDEELKVDLEPYTRKMQSSNKVKPVQQMQAATTSAMYACITLKSLPLAYKITRLTTTSLKEFFLQGIALVDAQCNPIAISTEPAVIFELYSVDTPQSRMLAKGTALEELAKTSSFDEYLLRLKDFGVQRLINLCDVKLDRSLQQKDFVYSSTQLNINAKESRLLDSCLSGEYANSKSRSTSGVIFAPCHVYVSTTKSEAAKIDELKKLNPSAGLTI